MYFEIQVSNPTVLVLHGERHEKVAYAVDAMFPASTEDAILLWNWVPVRINYKADLSVMLEDVLTMLSDLMQSNSGSTVASFGASTFRAKWMLTWTGGSLRIEADWDSIAGTYEELLNTRGTVNIRRDDFVSEWKGLLGKVLSALETSGVVVEDEDDLELLRRIESAIPVLGKLYRI